MYGLIKPSKPSKPSMLGEIGFIGSLSIALCSVSAVLYVMATAFMGGGVA